MARELKVRGLMNVQFAVKGEDVYVLEVNPRASRTVPFVSKAIGVPLAKLAAKVMAGKKSAELGFTEEIVPKHYSVKEAVFPFLRYQGIDISLGPEMKSTGEVMGIDADLGLAYAKSQMAAPPPLPTDGNVFISVKDSDKERSFRSRASLSSSASGSSPPAERPPRSTPAKIAVTKVFKIREGRPNVLDLVKNGEINFIINTPSGKIPREDEVVIRNAALAREDSDHDHGARRAGEREWHSLAAEEQGPGAKLAGISRVRNRTASAARRTVKASARRAAYPAGYSVSGRGRSPKGSVQRFERSPRP